MKKTRGKTAIILWNALGITVISAFFIFSMIVGGSAALGYREAGKCFVGDHGNYVEVSGAVWTASYVLEVLFWIFLPLTPLGTFFISKIQEKRELKRNSLE